MIKISDYVKKPSDAVDFMIRGLVNQSNRDNFKIQMSTFGSSNGKMCFGCAATCTIQEIANKDLKPSDKVDNTRDRTNVLGYNHSGEVERFELSINSLRMGTDRGISEFSSHLRSIGVKSPYAMPMPKERWDVLQDHNWCTELGKIQKYSTQLKEAGL